MTNNNNVHLRIDAVWPDILRCEDFRIHRLYLPLVFGFILFASQSLTADKVVINEIMYRAPDDFKQLEYVELWNTGSESVNIGGWRVKGIGLDIATGFVLRPDAFFVAARDAYLFERIYSQRPDGVFTKSLNNGGERLSLINAQGEVLETVEYDDKGPWPQSADGKSASLERISPSAPSVDAHNWAPSNLTATFDQTPSGTPGKLNSVYQKKLPPVMNQVDEIPFISKAGTEIDLSLEVQGEINLAEVWVSVIQPEQSSRDFTIEMKRTLKGQYHTTIPGQASDSIIRYRYKVAGTNGTTGWLPHPNALRPTFSTYIPGDLPDSEIPIMHFISTTDSVASNFEAYRTQSGRRFGRGRFGFGPPPDESEDEILRGELLRRLGNEGLKNEWVRLTLNKDLSAQQLIQISNAFRTANSLLDGLRVEITEATDLSSLRERLDAQLQQMVTALKTACRAYFTAEQINILSDALLNQGMEERRRRGFDPKRLVHAIFNIETVWFDRGVLQEITETQIGGLHRILSNAFRQREQISDRLEKQEAEPNLPAILAEVRNASMSLNEKVIGIMGDVVSQGRQGRVEREEPRGGGDRFRGWGGRGFSRGNVSIPVPPQGQSALVYRAPGAKTIQFFDHINILPRKSGYKVRLNKDRPLNGMTTLNVLFEPGDASTINEILAYPSYELFGNPTVYSGAARVLMNGKAVGYHLWFEQPNGRFFKRNGLNADGNVYKVIWQRSNRPSSFTPESKQTERDDIEARWEKVTHPHEGYGDLVNLIETLEQAKGDDVAMWKAIETHFDVEQVITYYATNLLLSHWDGYFNNYFLHHDTDKGGKWSMLPWDQDSTWSLRGGSPDSLSKMPLNYGGEGARPPGAPEESGERSRFGGRGFGGFGGFGRGFGWWRDGDVISKSLIGNPTFYGKYKARIKSLLENKFTAEVFEPVFDDLRKKLTPEVKLRATLNEMDPDEETQRFHELFDTLSEHLNLRRKFLINEINQ